MIVGYREVIFCEFVREYEKYKVKFNKFLCRIVSFVYWIIVKYLIVYFIVLKIKSYDIVEYCLV